MTFNKRRQKYKTTVLQLKQLLWLKLTEAQVQVLVDKST